MKAFWIIQIVSMEECSSLTQNLTQIPCSPCSVILNVMATQYTCSLNGIYHLHLLVQWSCHCSSTRIPVHSPWLPGCIDMAQTVLIVLTMAGLFPNRCHKYWDWLHTKSINHQVIYLYIWQLSIYSFICTYWHILSCRIWGTWGVKVACVGLWPGKEGEPEKITKCNRYL